MLKAFKTEIAPSKEQNKKIIRSIGIARFLYNQYIAYNKKLYKMYQRGLLDSRQKHFATAKDFDKYVNHNLKVKLPWIDECGSKARKKALVNAEIAFKRFFDGLAGFPRFKKKSNQDVKLYFPKNNKGDWRIWRHKLMIPTLKQVRLKESGYLPVGAKVISGTVSCKAGRFYVSVVINIDEKSKYNKDLEASYHITTDVIAFAESLNHVLVATEMSHYTKLNLTVVGREELASWLRDESLADFLSVLAAHGDILQVRVARRKSSRSRNRLVERRMDMSSAWVYQLW